MAPLPSTEPAQKEPFSLRPANSPRHRRAYVSFTRALSEWWQIGHSKVRLLYSGLWGSLLASIIIAPHFGQDGLLVAIEAGLANRNPSMYFSLNGWNHRFAYASEMHHRAFRMIAGWALEGAHIVARCMRGNACEHHGRSALGTRWTGDRS
jgi:hypothetical protein